MNKHLTGLVAVAAVVSIGGTSIPAAAKDVDLNAVKSAIKDALKDIKLTNYTTNKEVEDSYAKAIAQYDGVSADNYLHKFCSKSNNNNIWFSNY